MGLDSPGGAQNSLTKLQQGADRSAKGQPGGRQRGGSGRRTDQHHAHRTRPGGGIPVVAQGERHRPGDGEFNIPPEVLALPDFQAAAKAFISPDGHMVRYLVFTKLDPFSDAAMDQVGAIADAFNPWPGHRPGGCVV